ncbi:MAG: 7-carboxy-7-deazaguanine synthase QueE [Kiritimatiellae bacterium]|nr:7-carboxy-7-deazaguanine synthase QueE [Kiritimatiellia bacterium]
MNDAFPVVEIFASRQGEGANTGREAVFLRLGGCNLHCPWCDTDFTAVESLDAETIMCRVAEASPVRALIVTGGEPTIHAGLGALLARFKRDGYWIAMESNGLRRPAADVSANLDYLAVSPKVAFAERYRAETMARAADEVRIVVDGPVRPFCDLMRGLIQAPRYFLSPCERGGTFNFEETAALLGELNASAREPPWLLSVQLHKLAGFR